jgi:hypothetical protein
MHIGCPQRPLTHTWLQQSEGETHLNWSGRHLEPQMPVLLQPALLQHGVDEQGSPSGMQANEPQMPLVQTWLQQGVDGEHGTPSGLHVTEPHTPFGPQTPAQHWVGSWQGEPSSPQGGISLHTPFRQVAEQQSTVDVQAPPIGVQDDASPPAPASGGSEKKRSLRPQLAVRRGPPSSVASVMSNQEKGRRAMAHRYHRRRAGAIAAHPRGRRGAHPCDQRQEQVSAVVRRLHDTSRDP